MARPHLHRLIADQAAIWQEAGFPHEEFPLIAEILDFQFASDRSLRWLRAAQVEALVTYWYLRLVKGTPHILDLYEELHESKSAFREALRLDSKEITNFLLDEGQRALFERIRTDDVFVKTYKLESLRESLLLDYPSYILALTMGAGKTALIAAIVATEFAMAMEYETLDEEEATPFMQNALVFAPGKTILGSLRQIASVPYEKILPPKLHKQFAARVKLVFTRDGDPDISVIRGDTFNVVITNTEKIRITKDSIRKGDLPGLIAAKAEEAKSDLANRRLQALASLPKLGIFSDEAHHTYGTKIANTLKRVRETIDYLHVKTDLVAVINTTGTPYLKRQPLLDVVFWYGLSQGITDNILKSVAGNIHSYDFDDQSSDDFLAAILDDFFEKYRDTRLPDGHAAKLAIYFPQTDDLAELRPLIETKLTQLGLSPAIVLANTTKSSQAEVDAFERLNDPVSTHRVILLVNKGTEGWDCPSLFATALARKLKTSNNFVLQAACRCLRQVPGNNEKASIYLSQDNRKTLDKELRETYGESILDLERGTSDSKSATIKLQKLNLPPLVVRQLVSRVVKGPPPIDPLVLSKPEADPSGFLTRRSFSFNSGSRHTEILTSNGDLETIATDPEALDPYTAAAELAATFRLELLPLKGQLSALYPDGEVPVTHLPGLAAQIEAHTSHYTTETEEVEVALALVKPEGFDRSTNEEGVTCYTARISYPRSREHLLRRFEDFVHENSHGFSFHYSPYHFDSQPEADYFEQLLKQCDTHPDEVEDFFFTGALTDSRKTDFAVEYQDVDGKWRAYTPDFVIRRKDGRCLIVEIKKDDPAIKADIERIDAEGPAHTTEGRKYLALKSWEKLDPERIQYRIHFAEGSEIPLTVQDNTLEYLTEPAISFNSTSAE